MRLSELRGQVAIEVPGCARFQIDEALVLSAREFFQRSRAWREAIDPAVALVPGQQDYEVDAPFGTRVVEPVELHVDGNLLKTSLYEANKDSLVGGVIITLHTGIHGSELTGMLAVTLSETSEQLPDKLGREFGEALVQGALSRLLRMQRTQWSSPELSMAYWALYQSAMDQAALRAEQGFKHNHTRTVRYGGY